jgi:hypothetical protein
VFVVGQAALVLWIDRIRPDWKDPPFGEKLRQLQLRLKEAPSTEVILLLGSSRIAFGFDGQLVEEELARDAGRHVVAYNFGRTGGGPITASVYLRRLLASGIRPSLLVIEVLPAQFTPAGWRPEVAGLRAGYLDRHDLACVQRYDSEVKMELPSWAYRTVPVFAHRHILITRLRKIGRDRVAWQNLGPSGWVPLPHAESAQKWMATEELIRKDWLPLLTSLQPDPWSDTLPAAHGLEEVMSLARRRGIPTVLTILPEWQGMWGWYPEGAFDRLVGNVKALGGRYQAHLVNARDWVGEEGFADPVHLDPGGARVFTRRFAQEVLHPALEEIRRCRDYGEGLACTSGKQD